MENQIFMENNQIFIENNQIFIENNQNNMEHQPIMNLGTLGSVSDGKSTLIYNLTGKTTQTHSSEKERNITIKAGYANLKIWYCNECEIYSNTNSEPLENTCLECGNDCKQVHHISFVDSPGHQNLILTMMGSVSLMKGAIVVVSAAEPIKMKPQLIQHLAAAKLAKIEKLIICFNKLDLISKDTALERKEELDNLLEELDIKPYIIIPTSLSRGLGISNVLKYIMEVFNPEIINKNVNTDKTFFRITRSFDINKPGIDWSMVKGGVIGGGLISGTLNINDEIEIRPGIISKNKDKLVHQPIFTKVLSLETDKTKLNNIVPGGLIGIGTNIDSYYCKNDMLNGNVIGKVGELPPVYTEFELDYKELTEFDGVWSSPKNGDTVFLQIGHISVEGRLAKMNKNKMRFTLSKPVCVEENTSILVCRKDGGILKIVGYGLII
jgi:small GTP-binding protein